MATIATIDLPTTEFALYNKFVGIPAIRVEIEIDRPVTAENEQRSSSVRVSATDHRSEDEIERALATDLSVAALDRFAALDGEWLYRIAWAEATQASVRILTRRGGTILTAVGQHSTWTLRMLFPEREALARTYDYCTTRGLTFDVKRIYQVENGRENGSNGSTESADGVGIRVEIVGISAITHTIVARILKPPARVEMMQDRFESEDCSVLAFDTAGETKDANSFAVRRLGCFTVIFTVTG